MSSQKHKNNSYSVGGCLYSGTASIEGDITKTGQKIIIGKRVQRKKGKSMTVNNANSREAEGLGKVFKNLEERSAGAVRKLATIVLKKPATAFGKGARIVSEAESRNPKATFSTVPDVLDFYCTGKGFFLGTFSNATLHSSAPLERNTNVEEGLQIKLYGISIFKVSVKRNKC